MVSTYLAQMLDSEASGTELFGILKVDSVLLS